MTRALAAAALAALALAALALRVMRCHADCTRCRWDARR